MSRIEEVRSLIDSGQIEAVEDLWLTRQAEDPGDLRLFSDVATLLSKAGEADTASFLLTLLDEQMVASSQWDRRLDLLEACGPFYLEPAAIHAAALTTLAQLYPDNVTLAGLIEKTGLHRAIEDTRKNWTKIARLRGLMQFAEGTWVWMSGKGPGRVAEVNLELDSFKIGLRDGTEIRVGFAAAAKLLQPLDPGHIERRKLEDLDSLLELKREQPGELLALALESRGKPLSAAEIRQTLDGIVEESEWTSWWQRARKHPRILTSNRKGRQTYAPAASADHAVDDVRSDFAAADIRGKLEIVRRNASRSDLLRNEMLAELQEIAATNRESEPAVALEIWFTLERFGAHTELDWSAASIVERVAQPAELAQELTDKGLRERCYDLCWTERSDAHRVYRRALENEEDSRLLGKLADRLAREHPEELRSACDDILGHPRRRPAAFVWLSESGEQLGVLAERNPVRLIRQILDALHQTEFARFKTRLMRTFETGGGATQLFARLTEEQAGQAEQAVKSAPLDDHLRDSLIGYLHTRFPALDSNRQTPLYATQAAIDARRQELERLQTDEIPANRKAIEEARELGDLRENFEYKAARQRHEYLNARLATLNSDLARVQPLNPAGVDPTEVRVGCRVDLVGSTKGTSRSLTILGPWESDPDNDIVSYDSELGQSLLGKRTGDRATIDCEEWQVEAIKVWE